MTQSELIDALNKELKEGHYLKVLHAQRDAQMAALSNQRDHRSIDGLGECTLRVPADSYHYWGQRLGYQCWKDKAFLREFHRDNEECRVKSVGTKTQVGFRPGSIVQDEIKSSVRFKKAYN